ncbi:hypothetical protein EWM64_g9056 [Hericium alpestre]|uniref:RRM domain-containing protein n=1 Tax=Hericium alpestre TaxID=135208 RepID=A0A4Y9ZJI1_9AGAM|nr:hypothetical protein EWM64_g9056 [Hericium alpestre]
MSSTSTNPSAPLPSTAAGSSAETQAAAFATDPRIHYDRQAGTWRLEEEDGSELEYDPAKGTWVPLVDEELLKRQQAAYSVQGVDEEAPAAPVAKRLNKKRKEPEDYTSSTVGQPQPGPSIKRGKGSKNDNGATTERKSKNTAVYVTNLPLDTTHEELVERFSKCGLIEEDFDGERKVKMYAREGDDSGAFSGEALIVYFKEDSVNLALNILDDAELRLGDPTTRMRVQKAEFGHKTTAGGGGEQKERKTISKKAVTRRIGKMQKKLEDWDDDDEFGPSRTANDLRPEPNKNSRVVVLKHMFTLKELDEDPTLLLDLKEDVREECESLGEVTNVALYDREPDGIMTVKFRDPLSAQACVLVRPVDFMQTLNTYGIL